MNWYNILEHITNKLSSNKNLLNDLDQKIGDGDHGTNIVRGFQAIITKWDPNSKKTNKEVLNNCAMILISTIGGSSGPLLGTCLMKMAQVIDDSNSKENWLAAFNAGYEGIKMRGKSEENEKTMLDALGPALRSFSVNINDSWPQLFSKISTAANEGCKKTLNMLATKGRASYLNERSLNHIDPGAKSIALIFSAIAEVI